MRLSESGENTYIGLHVFQLNTYDYIPSYVGKTRGKKQCWPNYLGIVEICWRSVGVLICLFVHNVTVSPRWNSCATFSVKEALPLLLATH